MTHFLEDKQVVLGVTGSIAAYKSADLVRRLREVGAHVVVVMTENAKRFITPLTMQAVSGNPVHDDLFDLQAEAAMGHIELARWADVILVAPASADFLARLANGNANDLLTTICLATKAPMMVAPAMNQGMWKHTLTQENVKRLQQKNIFILDTAEGNQACGDIGPGRMLEPIQIREKLNQLFATGLLAGRKVLITAGPTQESIDPVRYISNHSSGKMGYALAQAAHEAGAQVTLISGPVSLPTLQRIETIDIVTAEEMLAAVMKNIHDYDIFLSVAAVSDYYSSTMSEQKIPKTSSSMQLMLERTPDILSQVSQLKNRPFIVGFAAETHNVIEKAQDKLKNKNLDMIIANQVGKNIGMGMDENAVTVISNHLKIDLPLQSKPKLARELISIIARSYTEKKLT